MSLSQNELLSIYHSARALSETTLNNAGQHARVGSIAGIMKRELSGVKECTEFDQKGNCVNPTCESGLHAA